MQARSLFVCVEGCVWLASNSASSPRRVCKMQASFTVISGPFCGQTFQVPRGKFILGRETDCHLVLDSNSVSRHHCVLLLDDYTLRIRDLASKNGTFVNRDQTRVGERICVGGYARYARRPSAHQCFKHAIANNSVARRVSVRMAASADLADTMFNRLVGAFSRRRDPAIRLSRACRRFSGASSRCLEDGMRQSGDPRSLWVDLRAVEPAGSAS